MLAVKNLGHEVLVVLHSSNFNFREEVQPGDTRRFAGFGDGRFIVQPAVQRTRDQRFHPIGGDPYNRVGRYAV